MKFTFFAALIAAVAQAKPSLSELENYTFEQFVQDFSLDSFFRGPADYAERQALFEAELKRVVAHNKSNATWTETVNHMSHLTATEKKAFRGRTKGKYATFSTKKNSFNLGLEELPASVDWRTQGVVTPVKDQGMCGSCWAFASTETIESHAAIASGQLFTLSTQQMAACSPNPDQCGGTGNCHGATAEVAFDYVAHSAGMMTDAEYPYKEYFGIQKACAVPAGTSTVQITGYTKLIENSYDDLMNAIANIGPMSISVDASAWSSYAGGIFNGCNQVNPDIDHAVQLVGYGSENGTGYWIVRNSWGPSWGEAGFIRVYRGPNEATNCGIDTTPMDGSACAGQTDPITVCGTCGILYDTAYPTGVHLTSAANNFFE